MARLLGRIFDSVVSGSNENVEFGKEFDEQLMRISLISSCIKLHLSRRTDLNGCLIYWMMKEIILICGVNSRKNAHSFSGSLNDSLPLFQPSSSSYQNK